MNTNFCCFKKKKSRDWGKREVKVTALMKLYSVLLLCLCLQVVLNFQKSLSVLYQELLLLDLFLLQIYFELKEEKPVKVMFEVFLWKQKQYSFPYTVFWGANGGNSTLRLGGHRLGHTKDFLIHLCFRPCHTVTTDILRIMHRGKLVARKSCGLSCELFTVA